ncbi:MAG: SDR family NAD(P)-dependent oxidoreductase [Oceanicaulis sp.]
MAKRLEFNGVTAVITGAASGIGEALAGALAARGANLALADIDEAGVRAVADRLRSNRIKVTASGLDVADRGAPAAFADQVRADHGGAALVFNNAGIAIGGPFDRVAEADFDRVIEVNFNGVVRMSRAFLPLLKAEPAAQLVNISSIFGIIAPPGQTAYSASKFAVRGFSMALAHELEGSNVQVSVVHPGGVNTRIAESAKPPADATPEEIEQGRAAAKAALVMPPPRAAEIILRGVEQRRRRIFVGGDAHMAAQFERFFPVRYLSFMRGRIG